MILIKNKGMWYTPFQIFLVVESPIKARIQSAPGVFCVQFVQYNPFWTSPLYSLPTVQPIAVSLQAPNCSDLGSVSLSLIAVLSPPLLHRHQVPSFQSDGHANYSFSTQTNTHTPPHSHTRCWSLTGFPEAAPSGNKVDSSWNKVGS